MQGDPRARTLATGDEEEEGGARRCQVGDEEERSRRCLGFQRRRGRVSSPIPAGLEGVGRGDVGRPSDGEGGRAVWGPGGVGGGQARLARGRHGRSLKLGVTGEHGHAGAPANPNASRQGRWPAAGVTTRRRVRSRTMRGARRRANGGEDKHRKQTAQGGRRARHGLASSILNRP